MRNLLTVGLVLTLGVPLGEACGDKLLSLGRGVRLQRAFMAARPASILIYSGSQGSSSPLLKNADLYGVLKRVGHKVHAVPELPDVERALKSGTYDIVLADIADAAALARYLQSAASKPTMLPVLVKPAKAQLAAAQKQYAAVWKTPPDVLQYLDAIDQAMKSRTRAAKS